SSAFLIFFFRQICEASVPNELLDAARIDGAGELRIFHRIVLPLLTPGLATMGIFTFIAGWNSFLMPLIIIFDNSKQVLPVMVALTKGQFSTDYGAQYVGVVVSVVPILIVFAVLSRRIIGGITVGALKG
ncbi:MAG: ABC transporter permease subunit, partial [Chloroflexota bacterium]|nr:ABC transporter permease subunit [Chloroflexota bacterium]